MTKASPLARPLLMDATVLVAYERDKTRRAQAFIIESVADGRVLVASAVSLAVAAAELAGQHQELSWLLEDPLQVLSLSAVNALEVGARATQPGGLDAATVELAHVVHEAAAIGALVLTYEPKLYSGLSVKIVDMRPR